MRDHLLMMAQQRGADKSFCPSETARALWPDDWRDHMDDVRDAAAILIAQGLLTCTQGGKPVELSSARGPVRLRKAAC